MFDLKSMQILHKPTSRGSRHLTTLLCKELLLTLSNVCYSPNKCTSDLQHSPIYFKERCGKGRVKKTVESVITFHTSVSGDTADSRQKINTVTTGVATQI